MCRWGQKENKGQGGYGDGFWNCPNCETKNAGDSCMVCGYRRPSVTREKPKWGRIALMVFVFLAGGLFFWMFFTKNGAESTEQIAAPTVQHTETNMVKETAAETKNPTEIAYAEAEALLTSGDNAGAAMAFGALRDYQDARERSFALWREIVDYKTIAVGNSLTLALTSSGEVMSTNLENNRYFDSDVNTSDWRDVISISACFDNIIGLRKDGTVLSTGSNRYGEGNVSTLNDIIAAEAGNNFSVFLRSDGKVVAVGNNTHGQCNVLTWTDIIDISAGYDYTLGLRKDGTVVAAGKNSAGQCDVADWTDIVAVYAGPAYSVGLRSDGTVISCGINLEGERDLQNWTEIIDISLGVCHTVGLKSDGSVITAGKIPYPDGTYYYGNVFGAGWKDIVEISTNDFSTVGLRSDGSVVAEGLYNDSGELNVSEWRDIKLPD